MDRDHGDASAGRREPMAYLDINIRLGGFEESADGGTFRVWVEGPAPGGTMRPDDAAQCFFEPGVFWRDPQTGSGGPVGMLERRRLEEPELYRLGRQLADLALPEGRVRELFGLSLARLDPGQGLRLRLHIDVPPLLRLPWEFLALPETAGEPVPTDFLALRREVSIVRTDTVESHAREPEGSEIPVRDRAVLVGVLSGPDDQPDLNLEKDRRSIEAAVATLNSVTGRESLELSWCSRPATRQALAEVMAQGADIFHFAGHGLFSRATSTGYIILERSNGATDEYPSAELAQLMRASGIRLAVLGACEGARRDGENMWSGVAPALTRQHIPAVVGQQFTIEDGNAARIAAHVYPLIFAGFTVDEALFEARQAIFQQAGLVNRDWGVPVLYLGATDGVLFRRPSVGATSETAGPFLKVANEFDRVLGNVVDVKVGEFLSGRIDVTDHVGTVERDSDFTSVRIERFGGPASRSRDQENT